MTREAEYVDVVDEGENILKVVSKQEAHAGGLLHKTVISEIVDSQGKWLLVEQSSDRQDAGHYVSPVGGHVHAGEANEDALKREAEEELGLTGDLKYEYVGRTIFNRYVRGRQENHYFIVYKIFSDNTPHLNEEADNYRYFSEDEMKKLLKNNPEMFGTAFLFLVQKLFPQFL